MGQISHGVLTIGCLLGICDAPNDGSSWVLSQSKMKTHPASNYMMCMMIKDGITGSSIIKWVHHDHFIHVRWSQRRPPAAKVFAEKILNALASWVVNIINFPPFSSPNNSIWKIIPNPAFKSFVDVAIISSKHKFYSTFLFNDKTTIL